MAGRPRNDRARRDILRTAADLASRDGLEGLTIGRLATDLGLSKSGLFGYFGSKQELQLATVRRAAEVVLDEVVAPAFQRPDGLVRLWSVCLGWLSYSRRRVFPGGCFFFATMAEFDARPGPVRDALAESARGWNQLVRGLVERAAERGELTADTDPDQLAFELIALMETANAMSLLHGDDTPYRRAHLGIRDRLLGRGAAPDRLTPCTDQPG